MKAHIHKKSGLIHYYELTNSTIFGLNRLKMARYNIPGLSCIFN